MGSAELNRSFHDALTGLGTAPASASPSAAIEQGRELVTRVGNQSNLILDPDLDSYYTMSIVLLRLPELLSARSPASAAHCRAARPGRAGARRGGARPVPVAGGPARRGPPGPSIPTTAKRSQPRRRFCATHLAASRKRLLESIERYRQAARGAIAESSGAAGLAELEAAHGVLLGELGTAWTTAGQELDRLLAARIDGFFARMWLHLGTALALLGLILTAVFFVARQIALPLRTLSAVADTVRRTGDHTLRASWDSKDEIGRLVLGFNDMLEQLDRHRAVQQELAASARAAACAAAAARGDPDAADGDRGARPPGAAREPAGAATGSATLARRSVGGGPRPGGARCASSSSSPTATRSTSSRCAGRPAAEPSWAVLSARRLDFQGQRRGADRVHADQPPEADGAPPRAVGQGVRGVVRGHRDRRCRAPHPHRQPRVLPRDAARPARA